MAESRSKSQEAAALLRRAASILTQNSAESERCSLERNSNMKQYKNSKEQQYGQYSASNSTCPESTSHNSDNL
jgi:hypothetical protein